MWVVKLGGSLAFSDELESWLGVLAAQSAVVVVPGGGPFADQVRRVQRRWGFDDTAAHQMALLAMEQYGRMLCALQRGLRPAATEPEIRGTLRHGATPVWLPAQMVLGEPRIVKSWDVTSDSLSAWLAARLDADALLLVKSVSLSDEEPAFEDLATRNIVDAAFPGYARAAKIPVRVLSAGDFDRLGSDSVTDR